MRGVVFKGNKHVDVMSFDDPEPGPGEAIVRIKASGMCGSDLPFYRSESPARFLVSLGFKSFEERGLAPDTPIIAGHEPCGVIEAIGPGSDRRRFKPGDRVIVYHYEGCGLCDSCRGGWTQMCDEGVQSHGAVLHGGHAHFQRVPLSCLVRLPDEISFAGGAAIACGTGTAFGAIRRLALSAQDVLAVFGLGPVGLSAVQLAAAMGIEVIGIDIDPRRVARAKSFGAAHAIDATRRDPVDTVKSLTKGKGASAAIDCAGGGVAQQHAVRCTAPWGRVALVAGVGHLDVLAWQDVIKAQRTIIGSYTFSIMGMSACATFIADRGVEVDRIFTDRWSLEDAAAAYDAFDQMASGKGVFVF